MQGESAEEAIIACSELIGSGNRADATLAEAFKDRGRAYVRKGDYDRAIEDFDPLCRSNHTTKMPS